jgi:flagellar operon protein
LQKPEQTNGEFGKILSQNIEKSSGLKFSKHAEMRLESRKIQLSDAQKDKINKAVNRAEEKGVKDSLILLDNIALVVNIKNKTVITAVNSNELKDNVFTNIDGAVFA